MRSSKSRQRNKPNRNRSVGNVINRVFDSSGPEGKVRGTPQQIIEKYNQLARDAQLSGDRVAAENFQQHAEHYQRLLNEAQREVEMRRDEHERQNRDRQNERDRDRGERHHPEREREPTESVGGGFDPSEIPQPDVIDSLPETESGLVETPESRDPPIPQSRPRKPRTRRAPRPEGQQDQAEGNGAEAAPSGPAEAAE